MTKEDEDSPWREEFERDGERLVYENAKQGAIYNNEAKHQAALRWLANQERKRLAREVKTLGVAQENLNVAQKTLKIACWTLVVAIVGAAAAIAAVIAAIK